MASTATKKSPELPANAENSLPNTQQVTQTNANEPTLQQAAALVQETKARYDQCESARMSAIMSGKESLDYSCEREFAAFKKAFDKQLQLESKLVNKPGV